MQGLEREGVGQLVEMGIQRGRATRPNLKVGICGEHGGEPQSGSSGRLLLRGRISPRWRAYSPLGPCRRTLRVRLRSSRLRAPTIIGISGLSPRSQPGLSGVNREGVGQLVEMGIQRGRSTRPNLKVGICGEHGGEPSSVEFCHLVGMDYVSCSPFRVPIARLAAAQAQITSPRKAKKPASRAKAAKRAVKK